MIIFVLFLMCILFVELCIALDLRSQFVSMIGPSKEAVGILMSSDIQDQDKEILIRRISLSILKATAVVAAKFLIILCPLYLLYVLTAQVLPVSTKALLEAAHSLSVLAVLTIAAQCYLWLRNVIRKRL